MKRVGRIAGGIGLIVVGVPLLPLPGPGMITILGGVTLLAGEFEWAKGVSDWAKEKAALLRKPEERRPSDHNEKDDQTG